MHGIFMIRKYVSEKDGKSIRTTTLLMHSGAFGLYLLSLIVLFATEVPYNLNPDQPKAARRYVIGAMFVFAASFVS
jgi:hypothetical protein